MIGQLVRSAWWAVVVLGFTATVANAQWWSQPQFDPTVDNPHWGTDLFRGTPVPTPSNPYWRVDPFGNAPVPR